MGGFYQAEQIPGSWRWLSANTHFNCSMSQHRENNLCFIQIHQSFFTNWLTWTVNDGHKISCSLFRIPTSMNQDGVASRSGLLLINSWVMASKHATWPGRSFLHHVLRTGFFYDSEEWVYMSCKSLPCTATNMLGSSLVEPREAHT